MKYFNCELINLYEVKINFEKATTEEIDFVKKHHYSGSYPKSSKFTFSLYLGDLLVGVALFGIPVGAKVTQKYSKTGLPILELRRLCLLDECPKNSESFFIAYCLRYLRKNLNIDGVISYADDSYGHSGTIYQASNFRYIGLSSNTNSVYQIKGQNRIYHSREMYQRFTKTSKMLFKAKKEGRLIRMNASRKHIYFYPFYTEAS